MRKYLVTGITLLCLTSLYTNLFAQEEKVIIWNPMAKSFINSSLIRLASAPDQEILADSVWQSIGPGSNDILGFAFGDNNAEIIYAASRDSGVFKTINGGFNWNQTNNGISDNFIRAIAIHPQNYSIVLAGTFNEGLYRTTDAGLTWNAVTEVNDSTILAITFDHFHGDTVYIGTSSKGVYSSFDGGLTWQQTTPDSTAALEVIVDPQFTNIIYYSNNIENRVYKSTDYGNSWHVFFEGAKILSLAIDPYDSNIIYMGTLENLYKSTDGGQNWDYLPIHGIIVDILIDDNNSNNVYLAVVRRGVFHSNDAGFTWELLNNGLTALEVLKLKFHPLTTLTLYASTNDGAIFKIGNIVIPVELSSFTASTSKGTVTLNWSTATEINNQMFEIERRIEDGQFARIGSVEGHGTTTEPQSYSYIDDISLIRSPTIKYRLKQIDFDGSYEYSDEVLVGNPAPSDYALHQNFPNPYNPVTTINYNLPLKVKVDLVVYNTLGESVTQLVNEEKEAGKYSVEFNAADLPSGIYFYRLQAGSFIDTKKMILLK